MNRPTNPVIGPPPLLGFALSKAAGVGRMVKPEQVGGRDVAPIGAGLQVSRALPVGLHCGSHRGKWRSVGGQSLIEYAVMVAAVTLGVMAAANAAYRAFVGSAQVIERDGIVF